METRQSNRSLIINFIIENIWLILIGILCLFAFGLLNERIRQTFNAAPDSSSSAEIANQEGNGSSESGDGVASGAFPSVPLHERWAKDNGNPLVQIPVSSIHSFQFQDPENSQDVPHSIVVVRGIPEENSVQRPWMMVFSTDLIPKIEGSGGGFKIEWRPGFQTFDEAVAVAEQVGQHYYGTNFDRFAPAIWPSGCTSCSRWINGFPQGVTIIGTGGGILPSNNVFFDVNNPERLTAFWTEGLPGYASYLCTKKGMQSIRHMTVIDPGKVPTFLPCSEGYEVDDVRGGRWDLPAITVGTYNYPALMLYIANLAYTQEFPGNVTYQSTMTELPGNYLFPSVITLQDFASPYYPEPNFK